MLTVNALSKRFGDHSVLESITFTINQGDSIGLIGPNGAGKTTLLRILAGDDNPDEGAVSLRPGATIGYLRQGFADLPEGTLRDLLDGPTGRLLAAQVALDGAGVALGDTGVEIDVAAERFDSAQATFEALGGYVAIDELSALLDRFGLGDVPLDRPLATLSGGQKTRAGLAGLFATRPDLLVLDEPTNHLDIDALDWLGDFLRSYRGAVLIVSHDRAFLDQVVTQIFALDDSSHRMTVHHGTYSDYLDFRERAAADHVAAYARQQKDIARVEEDIRATQHHARTIEANTIDFAVRKKAAKIARPSVVRKRKLERLLESADYVDRPELSWGLAVAFAPIEGGARDVAVLEDVRVELGATTVLAGVDLHLRHGDRLALTGANGSGKTTLMRVIAGALDPTSGTCRTGAGIQPGFFAQEQDTLDVALTPLEHLRREMSGTEGDLRAFLHRFLFGGEMVNRRAEALSYGERARLMLALLVAQGTNLLLLDEPLNHLDIDARGAFEEALSTFRGTIVMVLHDRFAIDRLATRVVELRVGRLVERDPVLIAGGAS